ncbi:MAG: hypothetical protein LUE12_07725 [Ruminococcus sp.]|nr:hypothetical protein [Ruminococcus sp.]
MWTFLAICVTLKEIIEEKTQPKIPAENWRNWPLIQEDLQKGVSSKERLQNLINGKYYLPYEIDPKEYYEERAHQKMVKKLGFDPDDSPHSLFYEKYHRKENNDE